MKKNLLLLVFPALLLFFVSCDNNTSTSSHSDKDSARKADSLTLLTRSLKKDSAFKIIKNYDKTKKVKLGWTGFDHNTLALIFSQERVVSAKFFLGAYLDDDNTPTNKKNAPVVILQVKFSGFVEYFQYFEGTTLCPPPDNECYIENPGDQALTADAKAQTVDSAQIKK
jgi:hypothetical protein